MCSCIPIACRLGGISEPESKNEWGPGWNAREHAVELARGSVTEDLAALEESDMETFARNQRKEHMLVRLRRLIPGASTGLSAMGDSAGNITADPT